MSDGSKSLLNNNPIQRARCCWGGGCHCWGGGAAWIVRRKKKLGGEGRSDLLVSVRVREFRKRQVWDFQVHHDRRFR